MSGVSFSVWQAIVSASVIVQVTLALLVLLSILTWSIGIYKWIKFKRMFQADQEFISRALKIRSLDGLWELALEKEESSLLAQMITKNQNDQVEYGNLVKALRSEQDRERYLKQAVAQLEEFMGFLATVGSNAPFIGLFGTVWGILQAFGRIGTAGQAQLAVVAPAIAEALFATAIGLIVAIPATILYNYFVGRVRQYELFLEDRLNDLSQKVESLIG